MHTYFDRMRKKPKQKWKTTYKENKKWETTSKKIKNKKQPKFCLQELELRPQNNGR
jgi:hypothetical protein